PCTSAPTCVSGAWQTVVQDRGCQAATRRATFRSPTGPSLACRAAGSPSARSLIRVRYAVHRMVVLRCTQRLLLRLKQFDNESSVRSTTRLGDWYGNVLHMGRRHALIFISERSRLPVLIPIREANQLRSTFPEAVCRMIGAIGVPAADVEHERSRMSEIAYDRTKNRSLLGTLNDMSV